MDESSPWRHRFYLQVVACIAPFIGKQRLDYVVGISAETVCANAINLQLVTIPAGATKAETKRSLMVSRICTALCEVLRSS